MPDRPKIQLWQLAGTPKDLRPLTVYVDAIGSYGDGFIIVQGVEQAVVEPYEVIHEMIKDATNGRPA